MLSYALQIVGDRHNCHKGSLDRTSWAGKLKE